MKTDRLVNFPFLAGREDESTFTHDNWRVVSEKRASLCGSKARRALLRKTNHYLVKYFLKDAMRKNEEIRSNESKA